MNYSSWNQYRYICTWHQMLSHDHLLHQIRLSEENSAHKDVWDFTFHALFRGKEKCIYICVCACDTTAIWASVSCCHGRVWCSWGDIPPSSPLSQTHLPLLLALTSFSFNERNVSITTYFNPFPSFRFITPLMRFSCHQLNSHYMWLHVKICRPINNQMCDLQTKCRITCIWTAYFW